VEVNPSGVFAGDSAAEKAAARFEIVPTIPDLTVCAAMLCGAAAAAIKSIRSCPACVETIKWPRRRKTE
jgi:hypothetical protein